jgi:acyl-CoA thioesterase
MSQRQRNLTTGMGDLEVDTRLTGGDGRWTAELDESWAIWGPCGGYVAAVLLRAVGAHSSFPRPATLSVNFLGVARFAPVELVAETLQAGKRSQCIRVSMTQDGRPISHAVAWTVAAPDGREGLEYDWTEWPGLPGPDGLDNFEDLRPGEAPFFPFWQNMESRPTNWLSPEEWDLVRPQAPVLQNWYRLRPTPTFDDPFLEAARVAMVLDLMGWPAVVRALQPGQDETWMAPNLDVNVTFHRPPGDSEFLLLDAAAPLAEGGTIGAVGRVWSEDHRLLASSIYQMLARPTPQRA